MVGLFHCVGVHFTSKRSLLRVYHLNQGFLSQGLTFSKESFGLTRHNQTILAIARWEFQTLWPRCKVKSLARRPKAGTWMTWPASWKPKPLPHSTRGWSTCVSTCMRNSTRPEREARKCAAGMKLETGYWMILVWFIAGMRIYIIFRD